jgi:hypothetical protein
MLRYICLQIEHEAELVLCLTYFYEGSVECEMLSVLFCFATYETAYRHCSNCFEWTVPEYLYVTSNQNCIVHIQVMGWL